MSKQISSFATGILDNPKKVILLCFLVLTVFCWFLTRLEMGQLRTEEQLRVFNPARLQYNQFVEDYGNDLDLLVAYSAEDGLFTLENLARLKAFTADLEMLPAVAKVTSLSNADYQWVSEEEFNSRLFLDPDFFPKNKAEAEALREQALSYEPYKNLLVSDDGKTAVIVVRPKSSIEIDNTATDDKDGMATDDKDGMATDDKDGMATDDKDGMATDSTTADSTTTAMYAFLEIETLVSEKYADLDIRMLGEAVGVLAFARLLMPEAMTMVGSALIVMILLLLVCFRSFWGVVIPGAVTLIVILMTVASFAMLDHRFGDISLMVTVILMAISLADAIHYYGSYRKYFTKLQDKREALHATYTHVFVPCLFTTISTGIGFAALSVATSVSVVYLAVHASIGACLAFLMTFTLLPALLAVLPTPRKAKLDRPAFIDRLLDGLVKATRQFGTPIAVIFIVALGITIYGISRLDFDQDNLANLPPDHPVLKDTRFLAENVGIGGTALQLVVEGGANAIKSPASLHAIDELSEYIRTLPLVSKVNGVADMMKTTFQVINTNDPAYHIIPDDEDTFGRLYYMVGNGEGITSMLKFDDSATVVTVSLEQAPQSKYDAIVNKAKAWVAANENWPKNLDLRQDGILAMTSFQYHAIMKDQINGFSLAFILITLMMLLLFRSFKLGMLSMLPNLIPIASVLGYMGWMGIFMSSTMIVIANISIGIAVDDTVHFLYNYRKSRKETGSHDEAVVYTMHTAGLPIIFTSFILIGSMLAFLTSGMPTMNEIGVLLAIPLLVALVADLLFLPEVLRRFLGEKDA